MDHGNPRCSYLCPKEIGTRLGVSTRTAQRLMRSGEIGTFRIGKLLKTSDQELSLYLSRRFAAFTPGSPRRDGTGG